MWHVANSRLRPYAGPHPPRLAQASRPRHLTGEQLGGDQFNGGAGHRNVRARCSPSVSVGRSAQGVEGRPSGGEYVSSADACRLVESATLYGAIDVEPRGDDRPAAVRQGLGRQWRGTGAFTQGLTTPAGKGLRAPRVSSTRLSGRNRKKASRPAVGGSRAFSMTFRSESPPRRQASFRDRLPEATHGPRSRSYPSARLRFVA